MYLCRLTVENFRNIESLTLHFNEGLNVLVGENNVGKTNVLDAIRIALGQFSAAKDDIPFEAVGEARERPIKIILEYAGLSSEEQAQFLEILNYNTLNPSLSTAQINFEWSYSDRTRHWRVGKPSNQNEGCRMTFYSFYQL
jgi:putative ATP-dependent endonuclease of OLD family